MWLEDFVDSVFISGPKHVQVVLQPRRGLAMRAKQKCHEHRVATSIGSKGRRLNAVPVQRMPVYVKILRELKSLDHQLTW